MVGGIWDFALSPLLNVTCLLVCVCFSRMMIGVVAPVQTLNKVLQ